MARNPRFPRLLPFLAVPLLGMSDPGSDRAQRSLKLVWEVADGLVVLRVTGQSAQERLLHYRMTVTGGSTSTTGGRARLTPGKPVTVATVRVNARTGWTARLDVSGDETYSEVYSGPAVR